MSKHLLIAAALVASVAGSAFAAGHQHAQPASKVKPNLTCPVTKEAIPSVQQASGHSSYHGQTFYFCCAGCKPKFDKDPTRYVDPVCNMVLPKSPTITTNYKGQKYLFCSADCKAKFDKSPAKFLKK